MGASGAAPPRVLVVDDDPDVLASLERGLRLSGFEVVRRGTDVLVPVKLPVLSEIAKGIVVGFGVDSYLLALRALTGSAGASKR